MTDLAGPREPVEPFELCTVAHLVRPTGRAAHDLETLLSVVSELPASALFHHTVQFRLREPLGLGGDGDRHRPLNSGRRLPRISISKALLAVSAASSLGT